MRELMGGGGAGDPASASPGGLISIRFRATPPDGSTMMNIQMDRDNNVDKDSYLNVPFFEYLVDDNWYPAYPIVDQVLYNNAYNQGYPLVNLSIPYFKPG